MVFQVLRSVVLALLSLMLLPAVALAVIGEPSMQSAPAALAGWAVMGLVVGVLLFAFISDAFRARLAVETATSASR